MHHQYRKPIFAVTNFTAFIYIPTEGYSNLVKCPRALRDV